jgi:peptidoglycan hydrolase-like protein with peptidoglycan-binding domain
VIPHWYRRDIEIGDTGPDVDIVLRKLGEPPGSYTPAAAEKVRGLARKRKITTDGEVNAPVAKALGPSASADLTPVWYVDHGRPYDLWDEGEDVRTLRGLLGLSTLDDRYDPDVEAAVRRFQTQHQLLPTGRVDQELAKLIGEA